MWAIKCTIKRISHKFWKIMFFGPPEKSVFLTCCSCCCCRGGGCGCGGICLKKIQTRKAYMLWIFLPYLMIISGTNDLMSPEFVPVESQIPHVFLQCLFMNRVCIVFSQNLFHPGHPFSYLPVSSQGTVLRIRLLLNLV